jgi:hypothetical protein
MHVGELELDPTHEASVEGGRQEPGRPLEQLDGLGQITHVSAEQAEPGQADGANREIVLDGSPCEVGFESVEVRAIHRRLPVGQIEVVEGLSQGVTGHVQAGCVYRISHLVTAFLPAE